MQLGLGFLLWIRGYDKHPNAAEVKSLWPISVGLHTCHKGKNNGLLKLKLLLISKNYLSSDCWL
jgi:hypothetical protein